MNNIMRALLEAKFPTLNINNLTEIVNATSNPEVAVELLCGIYYKPAISPKPKEGFKPSLLNIKYKDYNKWDGQIAYTYQTHKTKNVWSLKDVTPFAYEDYAKYAEDWSFENFAKKHFDATGEKLNSTDYRKVDVKSTTELTNFIVSYCSVEDWNPADYFPGF